jgi:hypothetical protein
MPAQSLGRAKSIYKTKIEMKHGPEPILPRARICCPRTRNYTKKHACPGLSWCKENSHMGCYCRSSMIL